jgi:hypothetical protein
LAGPASFWPLFDLVVRTPHLELRLPPEEEFADVIDLAGQGIHDPETMPFFVAWTDREPVQRARETAQYMWGHRAHWSPECWTFTGAVFVEGRPVGMQDLSAQHFRAVRSVGYEENGEARGLRRDGSGRTVRFRLGREEWDRRRRDDIEIVGLERCLDRFIGPPPAAALDPTVPPGAVAP